jgi:hypothetical protein
MKFHLFTISFVNFEGNWFDWRDWLSKSHFKTDS